mgnify:FL=1|tara:strand:+ start:673 stop:1092 length:420 start_codon:yes stop_codon:yes gene_type:complete
MIIYNLDVDSRLKNIIIQTGDKQNKKTAVKALMTDWNMREYDAFDNLAKFIETKVSGEVFDIWGALYKKSQYTESHSHKNVTNTFVYFIDVCEECAPLFIDDKKITPKNGKLLIFKDEVHYTSKHKCDHDRIIIAGNIK